MPNTQHHDTSPGWLPHQGDGSSLYHAHGANHSIDTNGRTPRRLSNPSLENNAHIVESYARSGQGLSYPSYHQQPTSSYPYQSGFRRNSFAPRDHHSSESVDERWSNGAITNAQIAATIQRTLPLLQSPHNAQGPAQGSSWHMTGVVVGSQIDTIPAPLLLGNQARTYSVAAGRLGQQTTPDEQRTQPGNSSTRSEGSDLAFQQRSQPSRFFSVGKVFLVLWSEPTSEPSTIENGPSPGHMPTRFGERTSTQIRRFVVVREASSYCVCLPILTYGGQGAGKPGLVKSEHAIVYTGQVPPQLLTQEIPRLGEKPMGLPIKVDPDHQSDHFDSCSRIDFGKAHSIQHNSRVKSFGCVSRHSLEDLLEQYSAAQGLSLASGVGTGSSVMFDNDSLLYKDFTSHKRTSRQFFVVGKVFRALWSEPGNHERASSTGTVVSGKAWTQDQFGEWIFSKVRMFVVVREGALDCQAIPITSYGGQGVAKPNVKASDHAIIYSGRDEPAAIPSESGLQPFAIRVDPDSKGTKLDPLSRIDFGRPCTIHNYMKVKSFGKVNRNSMHNLLTQYRTVQSDSSFNKIAQAMRPQQPQQNSVASTSQIVTPGILCQRTMHAVRDWTTAGASIDDVIAQIRTEFSPRAQPPRRSNGKEAESRARENEGSDHKGDRSQVDEDGVS